MRKRRPPRPPHPPRSVCRTTPDWLLARVSPSLYYIARIQGREPQYFRDLEAWKLKTIRWEISQRTCTRRWWDSYRKHKYLIRQRRQNNGFSR